MMKKFGRRTVLQLNDTKAEKKAEKPIGFGGLVQYGNENSESEEEEEEEKAVTPTVMPASPEQNGEASESSSIKNGPDMDTQLADFLAEIESISKDEPESEGTEGTPAEVETAAADSTSATPQTSKQITPTESSEESESEEEEPPPDITKPTEPSTTWQHCLDEGTQHYYYWNTVTNEVTWEIPDEYSKYLLLLNEYEERLAKYESTMKEWEERKKEPKKRVKKRKISNGAPDSSENTNLEPRPLVDYKIETPEVKPSVELVTNKYGRGLGFSAEEDDGTPYAPRHRATYPVSFVKGETVTNKLPELIPKVSKEPSANQSRTNNNITSSSSTKAERLSPGPAFPPETLAKADDSDKSDSEAESDGQEDSVQSTQLPAFQAAASEPTESPCNGKQVEEVAGSKSDSDMELEDFDVEDIDRQLELAFEKKTDRKVRHKRRLENDAKEKNDGAKKKRSEDISPPARPLQPRPPSLPPDDKAEKKKIIEDDMKLRAEVAELAKDINDKLDFLEISRKSMSQLQILLIETETRISDWREGGIESSFMLKKLQDAGKQLKRYESSAAPPGWSCHWDRTYKRYYYFNNTTGDSSWEYPEDEAKDNVTSSQVPAPPSQQPGQPVLHSTIQDDDDDDVVLYCTSEAPPPTNTAPLIRDQPIHFAGLTAAPPPPPSHPAPTGPPLHPGPYPDTTVPAPSGYYEAPLKLPPGITNPPPPPSSSPPPPPPGTSPPTEASSTDGDVQNGSGDAAKSEENDEANVISAAPKIRQKVDLSDAAQPLDGVPMSDTPEADAEDLPTHSSGPPVQQQTGQPTASSLPELSSSAAAAAGKEKKKKKKLGTGLAMKKKGVGNLVQKWQQIQEEVATKQKD